MFISSDLSHRAFKGKDGNVDWYFDSVCQVLAMVDRVFESMVLFKSGKSHQSDGTAYIICRGFCRCEFEAMQGSEILRKSIMVSRYFANSCNSFLVDSWLGPYTVIQFVHDMFHWRVVCPFGGAAAEDTSLRWLHWGLRQCFVGSQQVEKLSC